MKYRILSVLFLLAALLWANAFWQTSDAYWQSRDSNYNIKIASGASYTGPGDIVSGATAWYGLRAYNSTLANAGATTTPVIDVLGATTSTGCTIYLLGNGTGGLDFSTAGSGGVGNACLLGATTFCTVTNTSCTVSKAYDQTGNGNHVIQATAANQPTLTLSCIGSLPCLTFGACCWLTDASFSTISAPFSAASVAERTGLFTSEGDIFSAVANNNNTFFANSANKFGAYFANLASQTAADSALHSLIITNTSGDSLTAIVDNSSGTASGSNTNGFGQSGDVIGAAGSSGSHKLTGIWGESGVWAALFTGTQITNQCHNEYLYYGSVFTGSC